MKPRGNPLLRYSHLHRSVRAVATTAVVLSASSTLHGQAVNWLGNGTVASWNGANNTSPLIGAGSTTTDVTFNSLNRATTNDTGANRIVRSLNYGANITSAFTSTLTTGTILTFQAASGNALIDVNSAASGNITLGGAGGTGSISIASTLDVTHNGSGLLLFTRQVNGAGGITKSGNGTFEISAPNINGFTGAVTVNGGRLVMGSTFTTGGTGDMNSSSGVLLGGGTLEIRTTNAQNKSINPNLTVSSASVIAYNNTTAVTQSLTIGTGAMALNANLKVQNISVDTTLTNIVNITRTMTGSGNATFETYNNITAIGDNFSLGRIQLSGDNSGWNGNLIIAKGTGQLSGASTSSGTGSITIGTTGDSLGAGLGFNNGAGYTLANNITVATGGFRGIKSNGVTGGNITLNGAITVNGNLTVEHGLDAGLAFTLGGNITGGGALNVTRTQGNAGSSLIMTGTNNYSGGTTIGTGATVSIGNGGTTGAVAGNIANSGTLNFNRSNDLSFVGNISGTGGTLNKLGAGDLTLSGTHTYTGTTQVNAGKLLIGTSGSLAGTALTVGGAAATGTPTLGGGGTIGGATILSSAGAGVVGIHAPGVAGMNGGVGTQTFSNSLIYQSGSIFEWDLKAGSEGAAGTDFDAVALNTATGSLSVDANTTTGSIFKVVLGETFMGGNAFWSDPAQKSWNVFAATSGATLGSSVFSNFQLFDTTSTTIPVDFSSYGSFSFTNTGSVGTLSWSAVPEPSSALAGLLVIAGLLRRRRGA